MASFFEYFPLWLNFYFQKLPWNWFPWFHEFFGMDFLAHRNVQISTVYLHFRNTMLDWSSITSRFTIGWWITSLNSHWAPSTYEFSYEWLIEKKSCSRGYYYGVIESIINYWQPRKQNKKNLLQTETEEDKIKKTKLWFKTENWIFWWFCVHLNFLTIIITIYWTYICFQF